MTPPFYRVIEAVAAIAQKLGATVNNTGDRLADNLEGIANADIGGGGGGVAIVQEVLDGETLTLTTKAGELYSMFESGPVFAKRTDDGIGYDLIDGANLCEDGYVFTSDFDAFVAETADDYPVHSGGK